MPDISEHNLKLSKTAFDALLKANAAYNLAFSAIQNTALPESVKSVILSGLSLTVGSTISATDSVLTAFGKLQVQINNLFNSKADKATTLAGYGIVDAYNKTETESRFQALLGTAPANLDTLGELATQLANEETAVNALINTVSQKTDKTYVDTGLSTKENSIALGTSGQYLNGDKNWINFAATVLSTLLTGLSTVTGTAVVSSDSILIAIGKLQAQINSNTTLINGKEPIITSGGTAQYYRGDKSWHDLATDVLNTVLTSISVITSSAVISTDSVIIGIGKLQAQINTLTTTVANKADTATVNTALATKANKGTTLADYGIVNAYTKTETDTRFQTLVGTAPANLDTLGEITAQLANDESAVSALVITVAGKEPAIALGTSTQYFSGDKLWVDFASSVRASLLTGLSVATNAVIVTTDTVISALGKLQAQITALTTTVTNLANSIASTISTAIVAERSATNDLTNKTLINPNIKNYTEVMYSANSGTAITIDLTNGTLQKITLTANATITLPNLVAGKSYTIMIYYNGAFIPTFTGTELKWANQVAPAAKSVAGYYDLFVFTSDGLATLGRSGGGNF